MLPVELGGRYQKPEQQNSSAEDFFLERTHQGIYTSDFVLADLSFRSPGTQVGLVT